MSMFEDSSDLLSCTLGKHSRFNLLGKIVLLPFIIPMFLFFVVMDILMWPLMKRNDED